MNDLNKVPDMWYELEGVIADIEAGTSSMNFVCVRTLRRVQESIVAYHKRVEGLEKECGLATELDEKPYVSFSRKDKRGLKAPESATFTMKASEVINRLQELSDEHGDLVVTYIDSKLETCFMDEIDVFDGEGNDPNIKTGHLPFQFTCI